MTERLKFRPHALQGKPRPAGIIPLSWSLLTAMALFLSAEEPLILLEEPANLLRNTRFPLGLPAGWSISPDVSLGTDIVVMTDEAVFGRSGSHALKLEAKREASLFSEPFRVTQPGQPHALAIDLKGSGSWTLAVSNDGAWQNAPSKTKTLKEADEWTRLLVPFQPDSANPRYQMQLRGSGTVWIDSVHAGVRDSVEAGYQAAEWCEIALSFFTTEGADIRVFFGDEQAFIRYAATGDITQRILSLEIINVYGDRFGPDQYLLSERFSEKGFFQVGVPGDRTFGPFRVEAWIGGFRGNRLSARHELVFLRLRKPAFWGFAAPDSRIGAHLHLSRQQTMAAKAVGINWAIPAGASSSFAFSSEDNRPIPLDGASLATAVLLTAENLETEYQEVRFTDTPAEDAFAETASVTYPLPSRDRLYRLIVTSPAINPVFLNFDDGQSRDTDVTADWINQAWLLQANGYPNGPDRGFYRYVDAPEGNTDLFARADLEMRFLLDLLAAGAEKVFLYAPATANGIYWPETSGRVLTVFGADGFLHPTAAALSAFNWLIDGTTFVRRASLAPSLELLFFSGSFKKVAVLKRNNESEKTALNVPKLEKTLVFDIWGNQLKAGSALERGLTYFWSYLELDQLESELRETFGARDAGSEPGP